jgi:hypothetical protein
MVSGSPTVTAASSTSPGNNMSNIARYINWVLAVQTREQNPSLLPKNLIPWCTASLCVPGQNVTSRLLWRCAPGLTLLCILRPDTGLHWNILSISARMAAALLARLGAEALRPQFVNGSWRKAAISAKNQARLRRETLLGGRYALLQPQVAPLTAVLIGRCKQPALTFAWEYCILMIMLVTLQPLDRRRHQSPLRSAQEEEAEGSQART